MLIYYMAEDKKLSYSEELEKLTKNTPTDTTNKYIDGLVTKARNEGKAEVSGKAFWNGFLLGLFTAIIIMFFWRS